MQTSIAESWTVILYIALFAIPRYCLPGWSCRASYDRRQNFEIISRTVPPSQIYVGIAQVFFLTLILVIALRPSLLCYCDYRCDRLYIRIIENYCFMRYVRNQRGLIFCAYPAWFCELTMFNGCLYRRECLRLIPSVRLPVCLSVRMKPSAIRGGSRSSGRFAIESLYQANSCQQLVVASTAYAAVYTIQ